MIRLMVGDCRETLPTLALGSVQCVITSPPYYGLRDYGTDPLVWGGYPGHKHDWQETVQRVERGAGNWTQAANGPELRTGVHQTRFKGDVVAARANTEYADVRTGVCECGAWLGSLGLEPTPELFIEHLVEVFRHVRRLLRDDGTVWVNMGDSYAGSNGNGYQQSKDRENRTTGQWGDFDLSKQIGRVESLPAKNLMMMPARLAMALQADGWYLRSMVPWLKRNSMPESVTDRPASAIEYVLLLSKSRTYFWDANAVKQGVNGNAHSRGNGVNPKSLDGGYAPGQDTPNMARLHRSKQNASFSSAINELVTSRNRRNADWFFESWQGLMLDEDDDPLALVVNPAPYKGAHYATFPPKLVEPMVKASTRPGDLVLDPFGGSGTVGLVADRLGRNAILCELKPDYGDQATARVTGDAPLFVEMTHDLGQGIPEGRRGPL